MAILLVADHDNATLSDQTAKALTAAQKMGSPVHVLVAGKGAKAVAEAAHRLRAEYCVAVTGVVEVRPEGSENPNLPSGDRWNMWLAKEELLDWQPQSDVAKPYPPAPPRVPDGERG